MNYNGAKNIVLYVHKTIIVLSDNELKKETSFFCSIQKNSFGKNITMLIFVVGKLLNEIFIAYFYIVILI